MRCLSNTVGRRVGQEWGCREQGLLGLRQHHPDRNKQGRLSGPPDIFSNLLALPFIWATTILELLPRVRRCVPGTELETTGLGVPCPHLVGETSMWAGHYNEMSQRVNVTEPPNKPRTPNPKINKKQSYLWGRKGRLHRAGDPGSPRMSRSGPLNKIRTETATLECQAVF